MQAVTRKMNYNVFIFDFELIASKIDYKISLIHHCIIRMHEVLSARNVSNLTTKSAVFCSDPKKLAQPLQISPDMFALFLWN